MRKMKRHVVQYFSSTFQVVVATKRMSASFQNTNFPRETIRSQFFKEWITLTSE